MPRSKKDIATAQIPGHLLEAVPLWNVISVHLEQMKRSKGPGKLQRERAREGRFRNACSASSKSPLCLFLLVFHSCSTSRVVYVRSEKFRSFLRPGSSSILPRSENIVRHIKDWPLKGVETVIILKKYANMMRHRIKSTQTKGLGSAACISL